MRTAFLLPFAILAVCTTAEAHSHASHKSLGDSRPSSHVSPVNPKPSPTTSEYDPLTAHAMGMDGLFGRDDIGSEDKRSASPEAIQAWEEAHGGQPVHYQAFQGAGSPDVHGHYFEPRAANDEGYIIDKSREELDKYYANLAARSETSSGSTYSQSAASTSTHAHHSSHTHTGTHTWPSSGGWTHTPSVTHTHGPISGAPWQSGAHSSGMHEHEHHARSAEELNNAPLHQAMPHDLHLEHLQKRTMNEYYAYLAARAIPDFSDHDEVDTSLAGYPVPNDHYHATQPIDTRSAEERNADLLRQSIPAHPHLDHADHAAVEDYSFYLRTRAIPEFPDHDEVDTSLAGYHIPGDHVVLAPAATAKDATITPAPVLKDRSFKSWWSSLKESAKTAGQDAKSEFQNIASQLKKHF